jgi:hypothetical protein
MHVARVRLCLGSTMTMSFDVEGDAPLIAAVRLDGHAVRLIRQISDVATRLDDLHNRLVDIAEAVVDGLARR